MITKTNPLCEWYWIAGLSEHLGSEDSYKQTGCRDCNGLGEECRFYAPEPKERVFPKERNYDI